MDEASYYKKFRTYNKVRKAFFRAYFKIYHRLEVMGLENIPDSAALIAANHCGGFDLDTIALSIYCHPAREIHVLYWEKYHYLHHSWGRYWIGGGIPLWTKGGIRYEYIDPYLDATGKHYPGLVCIFPEGSSGTFRDRHVLKPFFPGVVRIAMKYRVPIVPTAVIGFEKASPVLKAVTHKNTPDDPILYPPIPFPFKLKVEFGKPFTLDEYYGRELDREKEVWIANYVVRPRVAELLRKHRRVSLGGPDDPAEST